MKKYLTRNEYCLGIRCPGLLWILKNRPEGLSPYSERNIILLHNKKAADLYTDVFSKVTWIDQYGDVIKTTDEYKGEQATPPAMKLEAGDGYRGFTNPDWLDEKGNKISLLIGDLDAYTFTVSTELPENPNYVAYMTSAMFNMTYYGHFAYNLYAPVVEGVTIVKIGDYDPSIKKINGQEYYTANAGWPNPQACIGELTKYIVYNIDGVEYTAAFKLSALNYANLLMQDPTTVDLEKTAVIAMLTYVEEVYKYRAGEGGISESNATKFNTFFDNYNGGERYQRRTDYKQKELHTISESFANYKVAVSYGIHSNNRMTILVTLDATEVAKGYSLILSDPVTFSGSVNNEDGSKTYYTNNAKFDSTIMASKYTISICDSEGKILATTNYSLATYCNSVDSDLADALYSFGRALEEAKVYLNKL